MTGVLAFIKQRWGRVLGGLPSVAAAGRSFMTPQVTSLTFRLRTELSLHRKGDGANRPDQSSRSAGATRCRRRSLLLQCR
ncbi:unnamed protein product [Lota lota]